MSTGIGGSKEIFSAAFFSEYCRSATAHGVVGWKTAECDRLRDVEVNPDQWTKINATVPLGYLGKDSLKVYFSCRDLVDLYLDNLSF